MSTFDYAEWGGKDRVSNIEDWIKVAGGAAGGTSQTLFNATTGNAMSIAVGTASAPDAGVNPAAKVSRLASIARASITGDGAEQAAAFVGICVGDANNQVQTVGVVGGAVDSGTANGGSGGVDACGVYGVGRITGSGIGTGIGAFVAGRRDTNTGKANGIEVSCQNYTASAGVVTINGFSDTTGLWIECTGNSDSAVGIAFGNPFGFQYDTGILFTSQVNNAKTGAAKTYAIRDEGNSANGILVNGTKTGYAIAVGSGAGPVLIAGTTALQASSKLEVQGSTSASADPLLLIGASSGGFSHTVWIRNGSAIAKIGIAGGTNSLLTGTVSGDLAIFNSTSAKSIHIGGGASVIQVTNANALGFFAVATPVAKQTVTGSKGANAALTSLMAALAAYGLVTDSTT